MRRDIVTTLYLIVGAGLAPHVDGTKTAKREEMITRMQKLGLVLSEERVDAFKLVADQADRIKRGRYAKHEGNIRTETLADVTVEGGRRPCGAGLRTHGVRHREQAR